MRKAHTPTLPESASVASGDIKTDYWLLLCAALLLIATGIGLRDPWPADEPRFALIARDMVLTGDWWVPRVGGDIYSDKPPLFFWLIAAFYKLTGSLRWSFLLPSVLSGIGCVTLVYDLGRRLWNQQTGFAAAGLLLLTVQFTWQARQAQIDATLCLLTTLSLYGLLRHLLLGPQWRWYVAGWAAAGLGVITKGVGFLPLLVLIPFALLRSPHWSPRMSDTRWGYWLLGPLAFLVAVGIWLGPILLAAQSDPALAAYRDEILFRQTIERYASAWHHNKPFWYFLVNVIPALWLPLTVFIPWLIPKWRQALQQRDLRIALLLSWIMLVIAFFSLSAGKRGVYVLPAVPAMALGCAPYAHELLRRTSVQRILYGLTVAMAVACSAVLFYLWIAPARHQDVIADYAIDPLAPLMLLSAVSIIVCVIARPHRGLWAYAGVFTALLLIVSFWLNPAMNSARSGEAFAQRIAQAADPQRELGFVAFKEQYLLNVRRSVVHFGHARWRDADQEAFDAAKWLSDGVGRQLIVSDYARELCFATAQAQAIGEANRTQWWLVEGTADPVCIARGHAAAAYTYAHRVTADAGR
ncbi:glycosyltransferase family 39 protein [Povalibacter sp.]|uniref:ArnT family glycosyltransferase n=1 Tax=Povalibacter sp. TaxID=1962978 RepID=UPI002F41F398